MDRRYAAFRYLAYSLEFLLLFILQTTPNLMPEFFGSKPLLLLPAALTVSYFESEIPSMFFGLAGGLMLDFGYCDSPAFFAFLLTIVCFFVSVTFRDYMFVSFFNTSVFTMVICTGSVLLFFLFFYVFGGKGHSVYFFVHHYISRIVYTVLCGFALYFINSSLYRALRDI